MWQTLVLIILSLIAVKAQESAYNEVDLDTVIESNYDSNAINEEVSDNEIQPRGYIMSWQARRSLRKILQQMPCGWQEYDIPPLAPYQHPNLTLTSEHNITNFYVNFQPLLITGLNDLDINKFVVSGFLRKAYFDFNLSNITATGKFKINALSNLLKGKGDLNIALENLRFNGTLRYRLPMLIGSAKIYDLKLKMSLETAHSKLKGTLNGMPITRFLNKEIEKYIMLLFNDYEIVLSSMLTQLIQTNVNMLLEGKKLWNVIWWSLMHHTQPCMPTGEVENFDWNEVYF